MSKHETKTAGGPSDSVPRSKVVSPFADSEVVLDPSSNQRRSSWWIWPAALLLLAALAAAGLYVNRYLNDPFRTLQPFPVGEFLENHQPFSGTRFGSEMRVVADLGWREGAGRLMLFAVEGDSRPVAVFLPADVAEGRFFSRGERLQAELEIKDGGLIHANALR